MGEHNGWQQLVRVMAQGYIQKHDVREPPTPVDQIVVSEGLTIAPMHWGRNSPLDGLFVRSKRVIAINLDKPLRRQRFSLAHELGHYALNHDYLKQLGDEIDIDHPPEASRFGHRTLEAEADEFANELLVPGALLKRFREASTSQQEDTGEAFHRPFATLGKPRQNERARNEKALADLFEVSTEVLFIALTRHRLL
jgi:Zn-dependent peptidase ImmA (M78 family)